MVQCMAAWFLADKDALEKYFGQGFNRSALPSHRNVENAAKRDIESGLRAATRRCKTKGAYTKGRDSFKIPSEIDPALVNTVQAKAS